MSLHERYGRKKQNRAPHSAAEWSALDSSVCEVFSPHSPIDEESLFAGRIEILTDMIDVVFQKGCHAILYGERGVGKTSFANILKDRVLGRAAGMKVVKRSCTSSHDYSLIWKHVFDDFQFDGKEARDIIREDATAFDILKLFEQFPAQMRPVIIIDEFDRIRDENTYIKMADTIKHLADYESRATIIIVGVGDSVRELFGGHPSIHRNIRQKQMPKMTKTELRLLIEKRTPILAMDILPNVEDKIVDLAQGFPGYAHLLCQNAFRSSVSQERMEVNEDDLKKAIERSVSLAEETVKESYFSAVRSTKPNHQYKEAILAFAMTPTNEKGYFKAADIKGPFSKIVGKPMDIPNYARHLKEFQDTERGPVLLREGKPKSYEYRFADPLLRPYAILAGISEGMIEAADLA